jgi:thioredoxin-like negative regulator of GroEL
MPADLAHTQQTPQQLLKAQLALVEFWAQWCPYSLLVKRKMEQLAGLYGDRIAVGRIDAETQSEIADAFQIEYIPAIVLLDGGQVVQRWYGDNPLQNIRGVVDAYLQRR